MNTLPFVGDPPRPQVGKQMVRMWRSLVFSCYRQCHLSHFLPPPYHDPPSSTCSQALHILKVKHITQVSQLCSHCDMAGLEDPILEQVLYSMGNTQKYKEF
jgi:hypothetical protein